VTDAAFPQPVVRRPVIDHVGVLVRDLAVSTRFYAAVLAPLRMTLRYEDHDGAAFGFDGADDFGIHLNEAPTANVQVAFAAQDRAAVDACYAEALANGGREKGGPKIWSEYHDGYYAAFV